MQCFQDNLFQRTRRIQIFLQYRFWHQLGGISSNLGYEVRWVLGAVNSNRWIEFLEHSEVIELSEMPQPEGWQHNRIEAIPTVHTIPSCAWQVSSKNKKGKFNRSRAVELGLSEDEKAQLASGKISLKMENCCLVGFRGEDLPSLSVIISEIPPKWHQVLSP